VPRYSLERRAATASRTVSRTSVIELPFSR